MRKWEGFYTPCPSHKILKRMYQKCPLVPKWKPFTKPSFSSTTMYHNRDILIVTAVKTFCWKESRSFLLYVMTVTSNLCLCYLLSLLPPFTHLSRSWHLFITAVTFLSCLLPSFSWFFHMLHRVLSNLTLFCTFLSSFSPSYLILQTSRKSYKLHYKSIVYMMKITTFLLD